MSLQICFCRLLNSKFRHRNKEKYNDDIRAALFILPTKQENHTQCERSSDVFLAQSSVLNESLLIFLRFFFFSYCVGCQDCRREEHFSITSSFVLLMLCYVRREKKRVGGNWINFTAVSYSFEECFFSSWRKSESLLLLYFSFVEIVVKWRWKSVNFNGSFRFLFSLRFQFETEICSLSSASWIYMSF